MRRFASLLLACIAAWGTPAQARPFTVEDLLGLEDLGRAAFSPDERWLAFEIFRPWKTAPAFDHDFLIQQGVGRLFVADLKTGGAPRPLLPADPVAGDTLGAFSPRGDRVIVYRLRGHRRELGIATLATGAVVWSGRHVEPEVWSAAALWRDDREVIALTRSPEAGSMLLGRGWQTQARVTAAWAAAARGQLSVMALGAGRYGGLNPPAPAAMLVAIDAETGATRSLASGGFVDLTLAPDGRTAGLITEAEMIAPAATSVMGGGPNRRRRLVFVDLTSGRVTTPCPACDLVPFVWSWSPDGHALVGCARTGGDDWTGLRYWRFPIAGGATPLSLRLAPGETGSDHLPVADAAWPGRDPMILARPVDGARPVDRARLDWWRLTARGPVNLTAAGTAPAAARLATSSAAVLLRSGDGVLAARGDRPLRRVAPALPAVPSAGQRPGETARAALVAQGPALTVIAADGAIRPGPSLPDRARVLALAPRSGRVVAAVKDRHGRTTLVLLSPTDAPRDLATINAGLETVAFAQPRPISHRGPDGEPLTSWLYLPPGHRDTDDRPVIVVPYPGARYAAPPAAGEPGVLQFEANIQLMVGAGYAVIVPSLPLASDREPMSGLAQAMLGVVDQARAQQAGLSATRLAVWGQSYGGYGALAAGAQSPRFRAVVASAPVTDLLSRYGALSPAAVAVPEVALLVPGAVAWSETGQGRMGAPPWRDPDRYIRNSPGLQPDRMTAPVLLIYGDLDRDVGQVQTLFSGLYRLGKDVQLLMYRGEQHVIIGPDNVRDLYFRAFAFLDEALAAPSPPPDAGAAARPVAIRPSQ